MDRPRQVQDEERQCHSPRAVDQGGKKKEPHIPWKGTEPLPRVREFELHEGVGKRCRAERLFALFAARF